MPKKPQNRASPEPKQTMISAGLYPEDVEAVTAAMQKFRMNKSQAIRYLIQNGAVALDLAPDDKP